MLPINIRFDEDERVMKSKHGDYTEEIKMSLHQREKKLAAKMARTKTPPKEAAPCDQQSQEEDAAATASTTSGTDSPRKKRNSLVHTVSTRLVSDLREGRKPIVEYLLFDALIAIFTVVNCLVIGLEVDADLGLPGDIIKNMIVAVWIFEAILKIVTYGLKNYFFDTSNVFDFSLALLALTDLWVFGLLFPSGAAQLNSLTTVKMLRLSKLIRVVRLLKFFRELWLLCLGLVRASGALGWVLILIFLVIYSFAILFTLLVGKECSTAHGPFEDWAECSDLYGSMWKSMYTLFEVMTLELGPVRPLILRHPWMLLAILAFVMITSFGLLNIIMGIIVDQVLESANENKDRLEDEEEERRLLELEMLRDIFSKTDDDNNGFVTLDEFEDICQRPDVQALFAELGLPVSRKRLATRFFHVIDFESKGEIDVDVFVERTGFLMREGKSAGDDPTLLLMDVRSLDRRLDRFERNTAGRLQDVMDNITSLRVAFNPAGLGGGGRPENIKSLRVASNPAGLGGGDGPERTLAASQADIARRLANLEAELEAFQNFNHTVADEAVVVIPSSSAFELPSNMQRSQDPSLNQVKGHYSNPDRKLAEKGVRESSEAEESNKVLTSQAMGELLQSQLSLLGGMVIRELVRLEGRLGDKLHAKLKELEGRTATLAPTELAELERRVESSIAEELMDGVADVAEKCRNRT